MVDRWCLVPGNAPLESPPVGSTTSSFVCPGHADSRAPAPCKGTTGFRAQPLHPRQAQTGVLYLESPVPIVTSCFTLPPPRPPSSEIRIIQLGRKGKSFEDGSNRFMHRYLLLCITLCNFKQPTDDIGGRLGFIVTNFLAAFAMLYIVGTRPCHSTCSRGTHSRVQSTEYAENGCSDRLS